MDRRLRIEDNVTIAPAGQSNEVAAIEVTATPGEDILIRGNRHAGDRPARIEAPAVAQIVGNTNLTPVAK